MTAFNTSFTFICDNCSDHITINDLGLYTDNLKNASKKIKEMGWQTKFEFQRFRHYCPKCIQPITKENR